MRNLQIFRKEISFGRHWKLIQSLAVPSSIPVFTLSILSCRSNSSSTSTKPVAKRDRKDKPYMFPDFHFIFEKSKRFIFSYTTPSIIHSQATEALDFKSRGTKGLTSGSLVLDPENIVPLENKDNHQVGYITSPMEILFSEYGSGVAVDSYGWIHLVIGAHVGDIVTARVQSAVKGCCRSALVDVVKKSKDTSREARTKPECKHFYECGMCRFQHVPAEAEVSTKFQYIQEFLVDRAEALGTTPEDIRMLTEESRMMVPNEMYGYKPDLYIKVPRAPEGEPVPSISIADVKYPTETVMPDIKECKLVHPLLQSRLTSARKQIFQDGNTSGLDMFKQEIKFRKTVAVPEGQNLRLRDFLIKQKKLADKGRQQGSVESRSAFLKEHGVAWDEKVEIGRRSYLRQVSNRTYKVPADVAYFNSDDAYNILVHYLRSAVKKLFEEFKPQFRIRNLVVPLDGYGFYPMQLSYSFDQVVGLPWNESFIRDCNFNAILNFKHSFVKFKEFSPTHAYDLPLLAADMQLKSDETLMVMEPGQEGLNKIMLKTLVQFGPRVIIYVSNQLESQISDLMYFTGGNASVQPGEQSSESQSPFKYERTRVLFDRFAQDFMAKNDMKSKASQERLEKVRKGFEAYGSFDAIGKEAKHVMQNRLDEAPEEVPNLLEWCTPGATYRMHSIRTLNSAPRTGRVTTIFILIRN